MERKNLIIFWSILLFSSSLSLFSQRMLLIREYGHKKNMKYFVGDMIEFSYYTRNNNVMRISGVINKINDETIIINYDNEVELSKIKTVFVERKLLRRLQTVGLFAGGAYLTLTGVNNIISNSKNVSSTAGYIISGTTLATALALSPLRYKRFHLYKPDKFNIQLFNHL